MYQGIILNTATVVSIKYDLVKLVVLYDVAILSCLFSGLEILVTHCNIPATADSSSSMVACTCI